MDSDEDEVSGSRPGIETTGDSSEAVKTSPDSTESSSRRRGRKRRLTTAAASASSGVSESSVRVLRNRARNTSQPKSIPTETRPKSVPHGRGRPAAESRPKNTHVVQPVKKKPAAKKAATPGPKLSRSRKGKGTPARSSLNAECKPESGVEAPSSGDALTGGDDNVAGPSPDEGPPLKDDPNDVVCPPETKMDKPRRRTVAQQTEVKKEEEENDLKKEESAKILGESEDGVENNAEPVRKRGRQQKDDKAPRVPKRRKKPPVQYVRCEMEGCGTVLAHPRYLQHHIKYQHLLKKKYVCDHPSCGRLFRLQKQLLRHAKHHTDQRDYICEYCARAFKSSHNLAVHRMIHTGEKPIQCEICGFTCRQKASLNWHMKKHDAEASYQFSCSICGKKFEKKDSVVAHKAKSHPEVLIAEALAANGGSVISGPMPEPAAGGVSREEVQEEEEAGSTLTPLQQVVLPPPQTQMGVPQGQFLQLPAQQVVQVAPQQQQQQQEGPTLLQLTTAPPPHLSTSSSQFIQLSSLPVCTAAAMSGPDPQSTLLTLSSVTTLAGPQGAPWGREQGGDVPGEGELWERVVVGEAVQGVGGGMWAEEGSGERRKESEGMVWGREGERQILLQCAEVHGDSLI